MQLRVYRSLLGSSLSASNSLLRSLASSLAVAEQLPMGSSNRLYDGVVLTMDQLMELKLPVANRNNRTSNSNSTGTSNLRLICQLEPACADDASDQLVRLANYLRSNNDVTTVPNTNWSSRKNGQQVTTQQQSQQQQQQFPELLPLQLDMVVVRAPSSAALFDEDTTPDTEPPTSTATCLLEYLSSTLPEASRFLESIPQGSVTHPTHIGHSNAHGNPLGQHLHGVTHHFTTTTTKSTSSSAHLEQLSDIADIFPPTRFALDPTNLRSSGTNATNGDNAHSQSSSAALSSAHAYGLSRELEGVVQNTDLVRVSPSTFQPPPHSHTSDDEGDGDNDDDNDVDGDIDPLPHGLFGAGTLFGEIWSAQELEGLRETYIICDQDDDHHNDGLTNPSNTTGVNSSTKIDALAAKLHRAFDETEDWRAGAKQRREEEIEAASIASDARRSSKEGWMQGRFGPQAVESARVLGLLRDDDDDDDDDAIDTDGTMVLTKEKIRKRWRTIAFQNHPDTATDKSKSKSGSGKHKNSRPHLPFDVLRQHFQTLMEAVSVRHDDK